MLCLAACSQKAWIDRLASTQEQRLAIETAQELRDGKVNKLADRAEPQLKAELPRAAAEVRPILARAYGPFAIQTVNVAELNGGPVTKAFTLEAGSGSSWALAEIVFRGAPGSLRLAGFHVLPANSDPSKLNDFNVTQRGLVGYLWLFLMVACVALCLTAVVLIWRRPWLDRRWLWTLGSVLGFAGFGLNWSTGAWAVLFVNVSLLGATATKAGPFAPWILTFGFPVIAVIVIVRWFRETPRQTSI
jgi:hypothetical protein